MAATRIMSIHINKGKTARQCIGERLDYIMNPKKTDGGILVSTYACSPETAADEFMLFRQEYQQNTGKRSDRLSCPAGFQAGGDHAGGSKRDRK